MPKKLQISKLQNGGRPPFWKALNLRILVNKKISYRRQTARRFVSLNI